MSLCTFMFYYVLLSNLYRAPARFSTTSRQKKYGPQKVYPKVAVPRLVSVSHTTNHEIQDFSSVTSPLFCFSSRISWISLPTSIRSRRCVHFNLRIIFPYLFWGGGAVVSRVFPRTSVWFLSLSLSLSSPFSRYQFLREKHVLQFGISRVLPPWIS